MANVVLALLCLISSFDLNFAMYSTFQLSDDGAVFLTRNQTNIYFLTSICLAYRKLLDDHSF